METRVRGWQEPPIYSIPSGMVKSLGQEAADLAASCGLHLDPWQRWLLDLSLGITDKPAMYPDEHPDAGCPVLNLAGNPVYTWSAFEIGIMVSRQNGKGSFLEARELAGLFILGEKVIVHSAHEHQTAMNHMERMENLIMGNPELRDKVASIRHSNDEKMILLKSGQKLLFKTRTGRGGRGLTGNLIVLDEAMYVTPEHIAALQFTLTTVANPQIIYTGSAGTKESISFGALRDRGIGEDHDPDLLWAEWSIEPHTQLCAHDCEEHDDPSSMEAVAKSNPSLGYRISHEYIIKERKSLYKSAYDYYLRERLGVGDWPEESEQWTSIAKDQWFDIRNRFSEIVSDKTVLGVHTTSKEGRYWTTIVACGRNEYGDDHLEITGRGTILDSRPGIQWAVPEIIRMCAEWNIDAVIIHKGSQSAAFITELEYFGIRVISPTAGEFAQACGEFHTSVSPPRGSYPTVVHLGQPPLTAAVAAGVQKPMGTTWIWDQSLPNAEISPLLAATLALWGFRMILTEKPAVMPWAARG